MGSKSEFPQILQKPARGTSKDDSRRMVRLIRVHVHVFASGRAKGCNTQSPMYTHTLSANHVKISTASANQGGFGSKGGENVPRMPVSRQKMQDHFWTPQGHFWTPAWPLCGWGSKGQKQNFPKIFQKPAEGTSKEAACPMARRIWAKWSNGACLRICPISGDLCQVCVIFLPFRLLSPNHFEIANTSANQAGFITKGAEAPLRSTNS